MKAMLCTKYGSPDVLRLGEVDKPTPKPNEVLIKIHATTVSAGDLRVRGFDSPLLLWLPMRIVLGLTKPRNPVLGVEIAGEIEQVGKQVTRFKKGDRVYALTAMRFGGYAEYTCLPEDGLLAVQPANATYEEAASIPFGGTTALYFLRKGKIGKGQKVMIYGSSGSVGTSAVQIAKYYGAEVTAVCSGANEELMLRLGADRVIDYTKRDFAAGGERYDLVLDAVGKADKAKCKRILTSNGAYITVDGQGIAKVRTEDMVFLRELVEKGALKPVIDRQYALEQIPEAHAYVETGRKRGNVVITVVPEQQ